MSRIRFLNDSARDHELTLFVRSPVPVAWRVLALARGLWREIETSGYELDVSWNEGRSGMRAPLQSLRETFVVEPHGRVLRLRRNGVSLRKWEVAVENAARVRGGIACAILADGRLLLREAPIGFRQRCTLSIAPGLVAALTRGAREGRPIEPPMLVQDLGRVDGPLLALAGSRESGYFLRRRGEAHGA